LNVLRAFSSEQLSLSAYMAGYLMPNLQAKTGP
jgi:hypothetical protein